MKRLTVEEYIDQAIDNGYTTTSSIIEKVQTRLEEIEKLLTDLDKLREEKILLVNVLRSYKQDTSKFQIKKKIFNRELGVTIQTDKEINNKIIEIMKENKFESIMKKDIIIGVGYDSKDPSPVYLVLKDLLEKGILIQNDNRTISRGPKWESE